MPKTEIAHPVIILPEAEFLKAMTGRTAKIEPESINLVGKICKLTNKSAPMFSHRYFYCVVGDYAYFTKCL